VGTRFAYANLNATRLDCHALNGIKDWSIAEVVLSAGPVQRKIVRNRRVMSWSIGFGTSNPSEELDEYLLALGKATYLACSFEKKCLWVVRIGKAVRHAEERRPEDPDVLSFLLHLDDSLLGKALRDLATLPGVTAARRDVLDGARRARNAIVHELGDIGPTDAVTTKQLAEHWHRLARELDALVAGDACISEWCHWIEEQEPPPKALVDAYPDLVRAWVLGNRPSASDAS
jgi:hypothetical protein